MSTVVKTVYFGLLAIFLFGLMSTEGWRPFKIEISNVTVDSFSNLTAINITIDRDGAIYARVAVLDTIYNPSLHAEVFADDGKGNYNFEIFNKTVDICRLFVKKTYEPLIQMFYKVLLGSGPWPKKCPIQKTEILINDWIVDTNFLPPYLPEKKLYVNLRFKNKKGATLQDMNTITIYFALVQNRGS